MQVHEAAKLIFEANHSDEAEEILEEFVRDRFLAQEKIISDLQDQIDKQEILAGRYAHEQLQDKFRSLARSRY